MYRNNYNSQSSFSGQPYQSQYRYTATSGLGQRAPLYPIGPTLAQPQFKPVQRGVSPSPYLSREGMRVPASYENRYLQRAQNSSGQINISYEQREKRLIDRNEREIEQQQKRRQQIRISYERQIKNITAKLNRNLQKKHKLHSQIQSLQRDQEQLNQKLNEMKPPQKSSDNLDHIDRKQQQMIILKNKLMSSMRENQIELNKKQEEEEKYWEEQISQKQKILFQLEQNLRDKRLELHVEKQKSLQRPDFLSIEEQVRAIKYAQFLQQYADLEKRLKRQADEKQKMSKQVGDDIELRRPQFHNNNIRREELKRQQINIKIRVEQLGRISSQMDAANQNLQKQLQRKQGMISKYQQDIHQLKQKKQQVESEIAQLLEDARDRESASQSKPLTAIFSKIQDEIKSEQAKGARLKNAYQKLYELLCSSVSKNIHQTFNQTLIS